MKKILILCVLMSMTFAGSAFAAAVTANTALKATTGEAGYVLYANAPVGVQIGKFSKGVRLGAQFNATSYALTTVHVNGSKYYGTAYDSTAIYVKTPPGDIGASFAAPTTSVSATAFTTGDSWASL